MRKKLPVISVWLIIAGCLLYYFINIYHLLAKTYYFDESQLYPVDTFHLLGRAHRDVDNFSSRTISSRSKLVFKSTNGYSFSIDKNIYDAIIDQDQLEDTLMYHDLKFTIFTNKEYYDKYHHSDNPIYIRVFQIRIGDTNYIDINRLNEIRKSGTLLGVFAPLLIIFFIGFLFYKEVRRPGWITTSRLIIWFIFFLIATILLFVMISSLN